MSSHKAFLVFVALLLTVFPSTAQVPRVYLSDPAVLRANRERWRSGDASLERVVKQLRKEADKALGVSLLTVTTKEQTPPSSDKHDYMSLAKYWWPDAKKPDGKPYIRRDGLINPETDEIVDQQNLALLVKSVSTLSLAYYFTDHERYADHAASLIRAWFLDPATRMNPNLNFAQGIPGRNDGRGAGIIDAHTLPELLDAIGLLKGARPWNEEDQRGMNAWCDEYLQWLVESKSGKDEAAARNNHGTWYDVQVISLALFAGKTKMAKEIITTRSLKRIESQISVDGRQPAELSRTKSWDYSLFNLTGMFRLAALGERVGIDVWHHQTGDGRGIRSAIDWLLPYMMGEKNWEYEQVVAPKNTGLYALLLQAAVAYGHEPYAAAARYASKSSHTDRIHLLLPLSTR